MTDSDGNSKANNYCRLAMRSKSSKTVDLPKKKKIMGLIINVILYKTKSQFRRATDEDAGSG